MRQEETAQFAAEDEAEKKWAEGRKEAGAVGSRKDDP